MKIKLKKIVGNLLPRQASKITHEWVHVWNSHLEIFSRLQVIENSGQSLLLRRDTPEVGTSNSNKLHVNFTREIPDFSKLSSMFFNRGFETMYSVCSDAFLLYQTINQQDLSLQRNS